VDDTVRRQLAKVHPEVPDTHLGMYNSHDVNGSCWTTADGKVPSSAMHCSTLANAPTLSLYASTVTRMIPHSLVRVNLLDDYRSLLALSANHICTFSVDWLHGAQFISACLCLIFCKFLVGAARFVAGAWHQLATHCPQAWVYPLSMQKFILNVLRLQLRAYSIALRRTPYNNL
jgi:hypothetical protein